MGRDEVIDVACFPWKGSWLLLDWRQRITFRQLLSSLDTSCFGSPAFLRKELSNTGVETTGRSSAPS